MRSYTDRICQNCQKPFKTLTKNVTQGRCFCCSPACGVAVARKKKKRPTEERFWKFVNKTDSCWLWIGHTDLRGYGRFKHDSGKSVGAHLIAWQLIKGPIPKGMFLCHNCPGGDNPACCNPDHLFLGTNQDNIRDAAKKGRMARGERHRLSKLTNEKVMEIRRLWSEGINQEELGRLFSVRSQSIHQIVHNRTWKHLLRSPFPNDLPQSCHLE